MSMAGPSKILLNECFDAEDDRFISELLKFNSYEFLKSFTQKWVADVRPWARQQMIAYLHGDLNYPGHEVVVKRLFKNFEAAGDHEMMAHFMVAMDRLVRRSRIQNRRYNWRSGVSVLSEHLFAKPNKSVVPVPSETKQVVNPFTRKPFSVVTPAIKNRSDNRLFTQRTRYHLRRRVWRYFRNLSRQSSIEYRDAILVALGHYTDSDAMTGECIIDNWSLMHACYFHSDVLKFGVSHTNLAPGASLANLTATPYQPQIWQQPDLILPLVDLLSNARCSLVCMWVIEVLRQWHSDALQRIDLEVVMKLLVHPDARVQEFAALLFQQHSGLPTLELTVWLRLIDQANISVLPMICSAMETHVRLERLSNENILQLCCAQPSSVARMGMQFLQQRHSEKPLSNEELLPLAAPNCEQAAEDIAVWAISVIGATDRYQAEHVIEFADSPVADVRLATMDRVLKSDSPAYNDPALWALMVETPYDGVRIRMIESLTGRVAAGRLNAADLSTVWTSVILNVHRGNRTKLKAVRQVTEAIRADHCQADKLLPVVVVAIRSIRGPERRNALAAIVTLALTDETLRRKVNEHLPELEWVEEATP